MKSLMALVTTLFVAGFTLLPEDAEAARRLGGARNYGVQRQVTPPQKAAPAQQQQQQAAPAGNAAKQAAPGNRWLGPLAGLAAGLGLGWLLSQGGFGALLAALVMALFAGIIVFALLRLFARPRDRQAEPLRYATLGQVPSRQPGIAPAFGGAAASGAAAAPGARVPAGFDVAGFVKQAKLNFMRLQDANDRGDLETLRDVATDELFRAFAADIEARGGRKQQTDISGLEATLLEVTTEGDAHWASISFQGLSRESDDAEPTPFHEIWHLTKPVSGDSGWLLAGIQQVS